MSADGHGDSVSLNKDENSSSNVDTSANKIIPQDLEGSSSLPMDIDQESTPSNLELRAIDDIETKQTLTPIEKEKALDNDSELDFELKWDDDNDLNPDDQSKMDTDQVSINEPEKVAMEQEAIGEPGNTEKQGEDTINDPHPADAGGNGEGDLITTADEEKLLYDVNTEKEGNLFKVDTNLKIDLRSKVSSVESDTNSLDEHLVYSDVDAPETEEKDLLHKLETHISDSNSCDEKVQEVEAPKVPPKIDEKSESVDAPETEEKYLSDELDTHISDSNSCDEKVQEVEGPKVPPKIDEKSESVDAPETEEKDLSDELDTQISDSNSCDEKVQEVEGPKVPPKIDEKSESVDAPETEEKDLLNELDAHITDNSCYEKAQEFKTPEVPPKINEKSESVDAPETEEKDLLNELDAHIIDNSCYEKAQELKTPEVPPKINEKSESVDAPETEEKDLLHELNAHISDNSCDEKAQEFETPEVPPKIDKISNSVDASEREENLLVELDSHTSDTNTCDEKLEGGTPNNTPKIDEKSPSVDAPAIEEKVLLDELDAPSDNNSGNVKVKIETPEVIQTDKAGTSSSSQHDLDSSTMDVEIILPKKEEILDPIDTSNTEMETSIYEVNNEHGLAKPDVMIEIPTQEYLEDLDDSEDVSAEGEQYDEDDLLNNECTNIENVVNNNKDKSPSRGDGANVEKLVADKSEDSISNKTKDISNDMESEDNTDIILEATHCEPNQTTEKDVHPSELEEICSSEPIEPKPVTDRAAELDEKVKEAENVNLSVGVSSDILQLPKVTEPQDSPTDVDKLKDASSSDNLEAKEVSNVENNSSKILEPKEAAKVSSTSDLEPKEVSEKADSAIEPQPSTSKYLLQELSDEDQEVTDSLGLLAESSRVMDDDDEQEHEDDDEDDDFDQDDESNQMTAEHSEDSNAQQSETDALRETMEVDESPATDKEEFQYPTVAEVVTEVLQDAVAEENADADINETENAVQALLGAENEEEPEKAVSPRDASDTDMQPADAASRTGPASRLRQLLLQNKETDSEAPEKKSPSKVKKLEITKQQNEINIVDLEESSSEDDIQEVPKQASEPEAEGVTSVNIPDEVEVMATSAGSMSTMRHGDGEVVISGVPKPPPHKPARLNTSEVTIKTAPAVDPTPLPDTAAPTQDSPAALKFGLEIFSLDSDDDEKQADQTPKKMTAIELDRVRENKQCVNMYCTSDSTTPLLPCDARCAAYYGARRGAVCQACALAVAARAQGLVAGVRGFLPLLALHAGQAREELVEISDSDSEDEADADKGEKIGDLGAKFLDDNLADMFNDTWTKYNLDDRLKAAQDELDVLVNKMEGECSEIDSMLNECQQATDKLRRDLYDSFAHERKELPAILIFDTPPNAWSGLEDGILALENVKETRQTKRRMAAAVEPPAKRPAIPLGYTPLESDANSAQNPPKPATSAPEVPIPNDDDTADVSVVKLSAEAAPAGLPPPGAPSRPPLRPGASVFAMRNAYGTWHRARVVDVQPKANNQFTMCRVKFEHKVKNPCKLLPARCLAYDQPADVRMTIGTRVIALFKDPNNSKAESYYSGIIAEIPNPVNNYRYLVFFDDGYAQYVAHGATRLVCECAKLVWDEVHPFSRQFVRDYLRAYPERPMVRAHAGQSLKTEWNGKWWVSRVVKVDASLVQVHFEEDDRYEWIYRGSTRLAPLYLELQAAERHRARPLPRAQPGRRVNMPYVEYTRSDEPAAAAPPPSPQQIEQEIRRQRAVAKKSTALPPAPAPAPTPLDGVTSRVVFYTPKNAIKPHKMVPHICSPKCKRTDVLALKDLRTYNPLTKPLLSGWERQIVKFRWTRSVMYRAPCGRRLRDYRELHHYLQLVGSDMGVDLFDFGVNTHCLAEFVLNKCLISKKDLSNGRENVPVPCVNYYDESLPEFCSYNTERTPTAGVPLNLDPEFLCGCDCTDDCTDKSKCACWKMTLEGARTIGFDSDEVGYVYKRLPEPLPSGIYECNSRCKCKQTCLNRVAQHPLQLKLQVFKTLNRGWGIRALNDVPRGAFLCVYAGNLLTDATANLDGLNEGDEYLAELDYIEVVEQMKEGFEEDIPDEDKKLDKKDSGETESSQSSSSSEEEEVRKKDNDDDDFRPAERLTRSSVPEYSKRLRKRDKKKKEEGEKEKAKKDKERNPDDNCITISDDEELREPARFSALTGMGGAAFVSKYKSVRAHFGKDEACYIMDAKVQGNIGRYLNHSCTPNVFVQNVFVDTHDPRFPWVAFFALAHIRAGTELTWNYNYDVGSVPGKILYCHCAAPNCRGRLL